MKQLNEMKNTYNYPDNKNEFENIENVLHNYPAKLIIAALLSSIIILAFLLSLIFFIRIPEQKVISGNIFLLNTKPYLKKFGLSFDHNSAGKLKDVDSLHFELQQNGKSYRKTIKFKQTKSNFNLKTKQTSIEIGHLSNYLRDLKIRSNDTLEVLLTLKYYPESIIKRISNNE